MSHNAQDTTRGSGAHMPFDPASAGWQEDDNPGFSQLVGPLWFRHDKGHRVFGFVAQPRHLNRNGIVHGGVLLTFADHAMGLTSFDASGGVPQATIQLDTHFVDAIRDGEFVEARCTIVRRTRSLAFMAGTFLVNDRVVATSSGVWKLAL